MTESIISEYMRSMGSKGGSATAKRLSAKQRSAVARKAAKARWKNHKRKGS